MTGISRRNFLQKTLEVSGLALLASASGSCSQALPTPTRVPGPTATHTSSAPAATATPAPTATPLPTATPSLLSEQEMALRGVTRVEQVAKLLGVDAMNDTPTRFNLYGADLGSMFDKDGKLYMVFGDSFGCCIPGTGGPGNAEDWRKNTMAVISDRDPSDGLTFDDMITDKPGHAKELLARGKFDKTVIPTYGIAIGERMYLHYMAVMVWGDPGEWLLNEAGLAYSDDNGNTWTKDPNAKWDAKSNFGQVAFVRSGGDVYLFGIPGGRFGGVKLARVSENSLLDKSAYRYLTRLGDGSPQWSPDEGAAVLIASAPVGELSVLWNAYLGRWIMTYLDESRGGLVIREAPELWGPWSKPQPLASGGQYPGLYGAYMHPWYVEKDGEIVYFTMSQWGPYAVFLMRAQLARV